MSSDAPTGALENGLLRCGLFMLLLLGRVSDRSVEQGSEDRGRARAAARSAMDHLPFPPISEWLLDGYRFAGLDSA